jgi:hypothetical protein
MGAQSFLQRLGFGISEAEQNQINSQLSDFERQMSEDVIPEP